MVTCSQSSGPWPAGCGPSFVPAALNPPSIPSRYSGGLTSLTIARPGASASGHLSRVLSGTAFGPEAGGCLPVGRLGRTRPEDVHADGDTANARDDRAGARAQPVGVDAGLGV